VKICLCLQFFSLFYECFYSTTKVAKTITYIETDSVRLLVYMYERANRSNNIKDRQRTEVHKNNTRLLLKYSIDYRTEIPIKTNTTTCYPIFFISTLLSVAVFKMRMTADDKAKLIYVRCLFVLYRAYILYNAYLCCMSLSLFFRSCSFIRCVCNCIWLRRSFIFTHRVSTQDFIMVGIHTGSSRNVLKRGPSQGVTG